MRRKQAKRKTTKETFGSSTCPPSSVTPLGIDSLSSTGTNTSNWLPVPRVLSMLMTPCISSTIRFTILSPRPVSLIKEFACANGRANECLMNSSLMPIPVSRTIRWAIFLLGALGSGISSKVTSIWPLEQNLSALPKRFMTSRFHAPAENMENQAA